MAKRTWHLTGQSESDWMNIESGPEWSGMGCNGMKWATMDELGQDGMAVVGEIAFFGGAFYTSRSESSI